MGIFKKKSNYKESLKQLNESKNELNDTTNLSLELAESELISTRDFFEKMKNHGIQRFDNLLNLCLHSTVKTVAICPIIFSSLI